MAEKRSSGSFRKLLRRTLLFGTGTFLLLAIVISALWMTGWPQREAIAYAGRHYLGAEIQAEGVAVFGSFRIARLSIYDANEDVSRDFPFAVAKNLRISYHVNSKNFVEIDRVNCEALELHLDATDPENTNFDFVRKLIEKPSGSNASSSYVPKVAHIERLDFSARNAEDEISIRNIQLIAVAEDTENFEVELQNTTVDGSWKHAGEEATFQARWTTGEIARSGSIITARLNIAEDAEAVTRLSATASATLGNGAIPMEIQLGKSGIEGRNFTAPLREMLPIPLHFERATLSEANIKTAFQDGSLTFPAIELSANVQSLHVGETGHEYYTGDLTFEGNTETGETNQGDFVFTLDEGQIVRAAVRGDQDTFSVEGAIESWTPAQVLGAIPVDFRSALDSVEYSSAGGFFSANISDAGYEFQATLQSYGSSGGEDPIQIAASATGGSEAGPLVEANLSAKLGKGEVQLAVNAQSEEVYDANLDLRGIDPQRWAGFIAALNLPENANAELSGTIGLRATADQDLARIQTSLNLANAAIGNREFNTVTIEGTLSAEKNLAAIRDGNLDAVADDVQTLTLSKLTVATSPFVTTANFESKIDLLPFVEDTDFADLYGEIAASGTLTYGEDALRGPITFTTEYLGYGALGVPYGSTLEGKAALAYNVEEGTGKLDAVEISIPERMLLAAPAITFATSPLSAEGNATFNADAALAVDMAWLGRGDGKAKGDAHFVYTTDAGLRAEWNAELNAKQLVLPEDAGYVDGVIAKAQGTYDKGIFGDGRVTLQKISAAGAAVRDLSGEIVMTGEVLRLAGFDGTLFDGRVIADIAIAVFEENYPIYLSTQFENLELGALTIEVQPGTMKLTGIANGSGSLRYSGAGLEDLTLSARSTQGFSLDRATVEELVLRDSATGGVADRQLRRVLKDFVGEEEQRPFDSAELSLDLHDGLIVGNAHLRSEKNRDLKGLNLNVNIEMPPSSLAESLVLLEQGDVGDVQF